MTISPDASVRALGTSAPDLHDTAFLAEGARVIGDVLMGSESSAWCNAVLRGDVAPIRIGRGSNLQDNVTVHVDAEHPTTLGELVSVGHNAVVHGCEIGDGSLVGMGSVVLSGAVIGESCLIAGGAVVLEGTRIPPRSLVAGVPAKVRRQLTDEEVARIRGNAERYVAHARAHAASM